MSETNYNVLLIEDLNGDAKAITQALSYSKIVENMKIMRASRLRDGINILNENKIDLILLDLSLPDSKDIRGVVEINKNFSNIPIIVLSDQSDEKTIQRAISSGASKFLVKSECNGTVMKNAIYEVLNLVTNEENI